MAAASPDMAELANHTAAAAYEGKLLQMRGEILPILHTFAAKHPISLRPPFNAVLPMQISLLNYSTLFLIQSSNIHTQIGTSKFITGSKPIKNPE